MSGDILCDANNNFILAEGILGRGFNLETNGTFAAEGKKNQKVDTFFLLHC